MTMHFLPAVQRPSFRFPASRRNPAVRGSSPRQFRTGLGATLIAACLAAALPGSARAETRIDDAWTRATVPAQRTSGAFLTLTSDQPARLVAARTPVAGTAEIHEMTMVDNVMRMRPIESLTLPAGTAVVLKPGGYHLMLLDLKAPLREGEQIPLTLTIENDDGSRSDVTVQATVRALTARAADHGGTMGTTGHGHGGH